ncbi:MAG: GyrI-like domain-containing protein [Hyphomicrobiales bacterium]|nr:GyrI-like domain-containing protein [Hyphomicrobiales bacterium]
MNRPAHLAFALFLAFAGAAPLVAQQAATPEAPKPATPGAVIAPPSTPAPAPTPKVGPTGDAASESAGQTVDVAARNVLLVHKKSNWDDGYKAINDALAQAKSAAEKAGLKIAGRPMTSFIETDENGFQFDAMIPVEAPPAAGVDLGPDVKAGMSPAGKALKFQHRGAYDDIDATYEAITAYLDEKGLEAQNLFIEEYINDPKGSDDTNGAVDIYVFVK